MSADDHSSVLEGEIDAQEAPSDASAGDAFRSEHEGPPRLRLTERVRSIWRRVATPVPDDDFTARRARFRWRIVAIDVAIIGALVAGFLTWTFKLWRISLRVPFGYGGDGLFYGLNTKMIVQDGWVQRSPRLGAPFGLEMYDFPIGGDNGNYLLIKAMSWLSGDWALLINVFFLLGFFTTAVITYLCLRWLGAGRVASIVCATLYAFAPFHFMRLGHIMLAHYAVVPIGIVLAVRAASGRIFLSAGARRVTALVWVFACICLGAFGSYWAIFSGISIVFAGLAASSIYRSIRPAMAAFCFACVIGAVLTLNQLGSLLYRRAEGPNPLVGKRHPIETDIYGLRLIQLVTPVPQNRFGFLRGLAKTLSEGYPSEGTMYFGLVGSAALIAMLVWLARRCLRAAGTMTTQFVPALLALLAVFWMLLATTGGFNWFALVLGFERIRGWNRASIVILFIVLAWAALVLVPRALSAIARFKVPQAATALLLGVAVMVVGVVDQTSDGVVFNPELYETAFESDRDFFVGIEAELPEGALVAQLPIRRFPEEVPTVNSGDYDLLRPYLSTEDLRWTYGGMKWRESEWQQALIGLEGGDLVRSLVAVGAAALVIDRAGYADSAASIESSLSASLGVQPRFSPDGRWSYFRLDVGDEFGDADALAARRSELLGSPILTVPDCGVSEGDPSAPYWWCPRAGTFTIVTPAPLDQPATVGFDVHSPGGVGELHLRSNSDSQVVQLTSTVAHVELTVPAGERYYRVEFRADVPALIAPGDGRDLRFILSGVVIDG